MSAGVETIGGARRPSPYKSARKRRRHTLGTIFIVVIIALILFWTLFPFSGP